MTLSKFAVCDDKKLRYFKDEEAGGLLSGSGIKPGLDKILIFGPILF